MTVQQRLDSAWRVDVGRVRDNNEDAVSGHEPVDPAVRAERGCLYVVADGMGGHAAGEVASNYAVQSIVYSYYSLPWTGVTGTLTAAIRRANEEIHEEGSRNAERRGMGSTVVAAAVLEDQAVIAHVGDSRAYLIRNGQPVLLTRDHTWVGERLAEGTLTPAEAERHPNRNVLTRNLGSRVDVEPEVNVQQLQRGDRLLLCSDGLWGAVPDAQIAALASNGPTEAAVAALVSASNAAGGHDNIGVALVRVGSGAGATTRVLTAPGRPTWAEAERATRRMPVAGGGVLGRAGRNKPLLAAAAFAILGLLLTGGTVLIASGGRGATPTPGPDPLSTNAAGVATTATPRNGARTPTAAATRAPTPTGPAQYVVQAADRGGISDIWQKCAAPGVSLDDYKLSIVLLNPVLEGSGDAVIHPGQVLRLPPELTRPGPLCNGSATPIPTPPPPTAPPTSPPTRPSGGTGATNTPVRTPVSGGGGNAGPGTQPTPPRPPTVTATVSPAASPTGTGTFNTGPAGTVTGGTATPVPSATPATPPPTAGARVVPTAVTTPATPPPTAPPTQATAASPVPSPAPTRTPDPARGEIPDPPPPPQPGGGSGPP